MKNQWGNYFRDNIIIIIIIIISSSSSSYNITLNGCEHTYTYSISHFVSVCSLSLL